MNRWNTLDEFEKYVLQESALNKLFIYTYPNNTDIDDILIKVSSLNDFYSTNIFYTSIVAKHILDLNIDKKLNENNLSVIHEIANVKMDEEKTKYFFSFATKYCSHHKPDIYPIYDDYVMRVLKHFNKVDRFFDGDVDFKNYPNFVEMLCSFRRHFKLDNFSFKDIDRYLWQVGRKHFPKKYGRNKVNNGKTNP